ncbi:MAG: CotH kinase family protein, partial [Patescibacteria group bacterium]
MSRYVTTRKIIPIIGIGGVLLGIFGFVLYTKPLWRLQLVQSPFVQFFLPTYRSLRKIADIPYLPYQFTKDDLPVYDITIDVADIAQMNAALPDDFVKGRLTDEYKLTVRAGFAADTYEDRVDIRYRGRGPNHWNAYKKSFHLEFDTENPFHGNTDLKLIIPEDRQYAVEPLNDYRAKKLGLFAPQPWFVRVRLNGEDLGVYHAIPHWSNALMDRNGFGETANIFGIIDLQLNELTGKNFFDPANLSYWEDYTRNADLNPSGTEQLKELLTVIHHASDELYARALPVLVDMEALYDWLIIQTLAASAHQNATVNIILLRNPATGRFQPIPWDAQLYPYHPVNLSTHPLIGRTLAVPDYRAEYLRRLKAYVSDEKNLEDDLRFYDETRNQIKHALFKDTAKLPLNFQVTQDLNEDRNLIEQNFKTVQALFAAGREDEILTGEYARHDPKQSVEISEFLRDATKDMITFIKEHPQFRRLNAANNILTIGPGRMVITKTAVLPIGTDLVIQPGTTIFMGEGASLVVYGRVEAHGTATRPIIIRGLTTKPWGSLLIIDRPNRQESIFEYVTMSGGSGFRGHGIIATGMLALHQAGGAIKSSVFENTYDDDAINIKYGRAVIEHNTFKNLFSDAIDLDSVVG